MSIYFENNDYKNLAEKMERENIKVDLILTDIPYNISQKESEHYKTLHRGTLDFGDWDYDFPTCEWLDYCLPLIRDGGSCIVFCAARQISPLIEEMERQGMTYKSPLLRWEKTNPIPRNPERRYVCDSEYAVWAVKGDAWTFNKDENKPYLKTSFLAEIEHRERIHPTQKEIGVIEQLIQIHSNEDDLVFDPFSGSGTTLCACSNLRRNAIGSERDVDIYQRAKERVLTYEDIITDLAEFKESLEHGRFSFKAKHTERTSRTTPPRNSEPNLLDLIPTL